MADLVGECYSDLANDGNYQVRDKFLGKVTISTLSSTSQSATLPTGTRFVKFNTDATVTVYFTFGEGSATATTSDQELRAAESEKQTIVGINGDDNDTVAARIA